MTENDFFMSKQTLFAEDDFEEEMKFYR